MNRYATAATARERSGARRPAAEPLPACCRAWLAEQAHLAVRSPRAAGLRRTPAEAQRGAPDAKR